MNVGDQVEIHGVAEVEDGTTGCIVAIYWNQNSDSGEYYQMISLELDEEGPFDYELDVPADCVTVV